MEYLVDKKIIPVFDKNVGKYFYQNIETKEKITEPIFDNAKFFSYGLAIIGQEKNNKMLWGYLNYEGKIQIPIKYSTVGYFGENNTAIVALNNDWFRIIDRQGNDLGLDSGQRKKQDDIKIFLGDKVICSYKKNEEISGTIIKISEKTITILTEKGDKIWRYYSAILKKI